MTITAIGVVVPARDEEQLLGACLDAIDVAKAAVRGVVVETVVVLDSCVDASAAELAGRPWVTGMTVAVGNVGLARRAGCELVLERLRAHRREEIWLANTDADSMVPANWLTGQIALCDAGFDAVLGTVAVADWSGHTAETRARWAADYLAVEQHHHVHGANLGATASAYVAVGGWPGLAVHEDVELVRRLASHRVLATATLPVVTSARREPRAAGGFGDAVSSLAG